MRGGRQRESVSLLLLLLFREAAHYGLKSFFDRVVFDQTCHAHTDKACRGSGFVAYLISPSDCACRFVEQDGGHADFALGSPRERRVECECLVGELCEQPAIKAEAARGCGFSLRAMR